MKKIVSISVIFLLYTSHATAQIKNDWNLMNLKGKVKSVSENEYKAIEKMGKVQKEERKDSVIDFFNDKGNFSEIKSYSPDGSLIQRSAYKYDSKGDLFERNLYNSDLKLIKKYAYKCDSKGNQIEMNAYSPEGNLINKFTFEFDDNGNVIERKIYEPGGSVEWKDTYKFENNGKVIERNSYTRDSLYQNSTYKYDNKGNLIEVKDIIYAPGSNILRKYTCNFDNFDKNFNWIKKTEFKEGAPTSIVERVIVYY